MGFVTKTKPIGTLKYPQVIEQEGSFLQKVSKEICDYNVLMIEIQDLDGVPEKNVLLRRTNI